MAITNIWEDKGLERVFSDSTSGQEVVESNLSLHGDPRFDNIYYVLNDFSAVETFQVSKIDVSLIASIDDAATVSKPRLKIAIVATLDSLLEWIYKYCEKMQDSPYECRVFSDVENARQWCGM
jgi:hypothetical protein